MKYGTDKCPQICHDYTPVYFELFNAHRNKIKTVVEMGIGTRKYRTRIFGRTVEVGERIDVKPKLGGSLKMWRDFFPNATIYGADIEPECLFEDERIKTYICDETNKESIRAWIEEIGEDIDIFIDDGSHKRKDQILLAKVVLPFMAKGSFYVIEDVDHPEIVREHFKEYHLWEPTLRELPSKYKNSLMIIYP